MFKIIISFVEQAKSLKWLYITVPVVLGVITLTIGIFSIPDRPNHFLPIPPPTIGALITLDCDNQIYEQNLIVYISRTNNNNFSLIIDLYGLMSETYVEMRNSTNYQFDPFFTMANISGHVMNFEDLPFNKIDFTNCTAIKFKFNLEDDMMVAKLSGILNIETTIPRKGYLPNTNVTIKIPEKNRTLLSSPNNTLILPLTETFGGVRIDIECQDCLRGSNSEAAIALHTSLWGSSEFDSLTSISISSLHGNPKVEARSNNRYLVEPWGYGSNLNRIGYSLKGTPTSRINSMKTVWVDLDAERRSSVFNLLAGVLIGIGISLLTEALIVSLHTVFSRID